MTPSFLQRLSLRAKLYLNLGALCLLLGIVSVFANFALSIAAAQSKETLRTTVRQADLASQVTQFTLECRRYEKDQFLNVRDVGVRENYTKKWHEAFDGLTAAIAEYEAAPGDGRETAVNWSSDATQYRQAMESFFRGVTDKTIQNPEQANALLTPFKNPIRKLTDSSVDTARTKMIQARDAQHALAGAVAFLQWLILTVTVAAAVGSVVWSYFLAADLLRPINALSAAALRFGEGDLYARVDLHREDELGKLADCFNQMTARIRERTGEMAS